MSEPTSHPAPNTSTPLPRRRFLGKLIAVGAAGLGGSTLLAACGGGDAETAVGAEYPVVNASSCQGYGALDPGALTTRQALNYQDDTPEEGEYCGNCRFQQAYEADAQCLGCQLFPGPVSPGGWCQSWAAVAA